MNASYGIELRQPVAGDLIGSKLTIAAVGTAFEGSYGWRLVAGRDVVAEGFFQAGSMGTMEAFVYEADLSFEYLGNAQFEFFGDDPSGEHTPGVDLNRVPVILIPGIRGYGVHEVVRGDTLSKIAREYGSSVQHIAVANGIDDPDLIHPGAALRIPV